MLDVSHRPPDPTHPVICLDETNRQLLDETRPPQPAAPGHPARHDPEYVQGGIANLFLATDPLRGWRAVMVSTQRTRLDFAACIKELVEVHYPDAERIVLVQDNLNIHTPAALYAALSPEEGKRLTDNISWHYTPKHGSWLSMAEIELSALNRQCLNRRIPDMVTLKTEVAAWVARRDAASIRIDWRFTTADARIKLTPLYPVL